MKVLHVIPAVAPRYGGPSTAIVPMCLALAARTVDPLLVTTDADGPGRLSVPIGQPNAWHEVPSLFFKRDFSESFKYSRGLARWLVRHVADFDVVHVHGALSHAPLAAAAACRVARVPYVVRPLGTLTPWSLAQNKWKKRALLELGGIRMLREAAAIHYTSTGEQLGVERGLGVSRGVVIPLGVDARYLEQPLVPAAERALNPYVLALSRLHPKKNLEVLIDAFIDVCRNRQPWRLVIAGSGDQAYAQALKRFVQDRHAEGCVTFTGWVEGNSKHQLTARASLFAIPSLDENFGVSLIEALATGVPALVSRQVHLADAVEDGGAGWIVDTNLDSIRRGLAEAIVSDAGRESRGRAARRVAARFAWSGVASQLAELYEQIVGVKPGTTGLVGRAPRTKPPVGIGHSVRPQADHDVDEQSAAAAPSPAVPVNH